ncbi:hypothetical protein PAPYR_6806 [Paratrimastix pyriformis]|uniref:Uncharacterized protein n=1 Tax=Paratrimastix pyriformis TaxID=342808 RepID=A0ABQ8UIC5_9EUKA|nr:hypothetical protein PAPYR_6806 [Paratrimastix pyriformis]
MGLLPTRSWPTRPRPKEGEPPQGPQEIIIPFCEGEEETIRDDQRLLAALELDKTKKFRAWVQLLSLAHQTQALTQRDGPLAGSGHGSGRPLRDRLAKASLLAFLTHNFDRTLLCLFNEIPFFWQKHPTFNVPPRRPGALQAPASCASCSSSARVPRLISRSPDPLFPLTPPCSTQTTT